LILVIHKLTTMYLSKEKAKCHATLGSYTDKMKLGSIQKNKKNGGTHFRNSEGEAEHSIT
jgi:hypothetical protein